MNVLLVVPFSSDDLDRHAACRWVRQRYEQCHPDWQLVIAREGEIEPAKKGEPEFSKAIAVNRAVSWWRLDGNPVDVIVVADADVFVPTDALTHAVTEAGTRARWAVPHRTVYRLDPPGSAHHLRGPVDLEPIDLDHGPWAIRPKFGLAGGGIVVMHCSAWDDVRGLDERFIGWGGEDVSLGWALEAIVGPGVRIGAPMWHFHHKPPRRFSTEAYRDALWLQERYRRARFQREPMLELLAERGPALAQTPAM